MRPLSVGVVGVSSSALPWKYLGPDIKAGVAAAGLSPPRPLPPDRQPEPSAAAAGAAGCAFGFLVGPVAGQLGFP